MTQQGKTALVLAGGGLTGAVYEIGALRAVNEILIDRTVNDFDIYVGTSAGSIIGASLANGLTPDEMLGSIAGEHAELPPIEQSDLFGLNYPDLVRWGKRLPRTLLGAWSHYLRHYTDMTLFDVLWSLTDALPSGLYDSGALEKYMRRVITSQPGCTNRFADLDRDLFIIATDLDSGRRAVFSKEGPVHTTIARAVSASSAIPVFYKPVRIHDHDYVDGGMRGNASIDVAIEHGATLVLCINPLVPFDNSDRQHIPFLGPDGGRLSDKGISAIASQVGRIYAHSGLHYHIKQLRRTHPEVDIILIEPSRTDYQMFFYNIMRYSARMIVAQHGFESVTVNLAEEFDVVEPMLARHHIPINRRLVLEEMAKLRAANYDKKVLRQALLNNPPPVPRARRSRPLRDTRHLRETLDALEETLGRLES